MENYKIRCDIFDFRRHIAFDTSQMELPAKCDLCSKHATHFCMVHRGIYSVDHISNHDGITVDSFDTSQDSAALVKKFGVLEDGIPVFSEEDIDLVVQRTGVDREKARHALVQANGDLARVILILMTG